MINFGAGKNASRLSLFLAPFPLDVERLVLIKACQYDLEVLGGERSLITSGVQAAKQGRRLLICPCEIML